MSVTPAVVFSIGSGLVAGVAGIAVALRTARRRRAVPLWFAVAALAAALWAGGYGLFLYVEAPSVWILAPSIVGAAVFPAGWFAFVLAYAGYGTVLDLRGTSILAFVPLVVAVSGILHPGFPLSPLHYSPSPEAAGLPLIGPPFVLYLAFLFFFGLGSIVLLGRTLRRTEDVYRRQTWLLLGATALTLLGILGTLTEGAAGIDLTPHFAAIAAGAVFFGTVRYPVFDVTPLARDRIVERLRDPIVVLDGDDRVIEANEAAKHWLGLPDSVAGDTVEEHPPIDRIRCLLSETEPTCDEDVDWITVLESGADGTLHEPEEYPVGVPNGGTGVVAGGTADVGTGPGSDFSAGIGNRFGTGKAGERGDTYFAQTQVDSDADSEAAETENGRTIGAFRERSIDRETVLEIRTEETFGCFRVSERSIGRAATDEGQMLVMRDVTAEHRAERRFRSLIEHTTDLIMVLERDGTITYCSPSIQRGLGYDPARQVGRRVFDLVHLEDRAQAIERFDRAIGTDEEVRARLRLRKRDGTYRTYEWAVVDRLDTPHVEGVVVSARDVTRAHQYERQLRVMNRVLRHDLRNEMNVILGHVELLAEEDDVGHLETIEDRARSLVELGEKARDVDRALSRSSDRQPTGLSAMVREEVTALSEQATDVEIETSIEPDVRVLGDTSLRSAVRNAIENAIEHNDAADPRVTVELWSDDEIASLSIADNGPGLPETERRVLNAGMETPLEHTSGLGLWLIVWTVEAIGGRVEFDSTDEGTEVLFEFDLAASADASNETGTK